MERQWGDLDKYRGISTSSKGAHIINGPERPHCSHHCLHLLHTPPREYPSLAWLYLLYDSLLLGAGNYVVGGVQLGNVWIGVQPALGLEGDPMRLLFERDLTPHPQYAGAN